MTIGSVEDMSVTDARRGAQKLIVQVNDGVDPLEDQRRQIIDRQSEARRAPTVADLVNRYIEEHLPTKRPRSQVEDRTMIKLYILPHLGDAKVEEVTHSDITALHRKITQAGRGTRANAVKRLLSKMFRLAILWSCAATIPPREW